MHKEILDEFYEKEAVPRLKSALEKAELYFQENRKHLKEKFLLEFSQMLRQAKNIQEKKSITIGFMMFHALRNRILRHDYRYQVWIYDEDWYVHEGFPVGDFDVRFVYQYYEEMWGDLLTHYPKYFGKITECDVNQIMLGILDEFHVYVNELLRYSIVDASESEEYQNLIRGEVFHIESGEIMEPCDVIWIEDKSKKLRKIKKWLDKKEEGSYCFADFQGLNLGAITYQKMDLRYAGFQESNLCQARLHICKLMGTKFRRANMREASLMVSWISGADFQIALR